MEVEENSAKIDLSSSTAAPHCKMKSEESTVTKLYAPKVTNGWNNMPELVLYEIYSYLPMRDRMNASSTCKQWRESLFMKKFWENFHFKFIKSDTDIELKVRFYKYIFAKRITNAVLTFNSLDPLCLDAVFKLLTSFCHNKNLKELSLVPNNCELYPVPAKYHLRRVKWFSNIHRMLCMLLKKWSELRRLSLGCLEELLYNSNEIVQLAVKHQSTSLEVLALASLKFDSIKNSMDYIEFHSFKNLQILSIDLNNISNDFLMMLSNCTLLKRMVIHVHDSYVDYVHDWAWKLLVQRCPNVQVRLNIIRNFRIGQFGFEDDILLPSMPLTHVRVLFCEKITPEFLERLGLIFSDTLESVWWIDSFNSSFSAKLIDDHNLERMNPFVYVSWKCTKLREMVVYGYKNFAEDVLGVIKLRSETLKDLRFAESDIVFTPDCPLTLNKIESEASNLLNMQWRAFRDDELHHVIRNRLDDGTSNEFIRPIVLSDLD